MNNVLKVLHILGQRLDKILLHHAKCWIRLQRIQPVRHPAHEVVPDSHSNTFLIRIIAIPVQSSLYKVITQESGPPGNQHMLTRHIRKLVAEIVAEIGQVLGNELFF